MEAYKKFGDGIHLASILGNKTLTSIMKSFNSLLSPPIVQVAFLIILSSLIIESVSEFMTNYNPDETVIQTKGTFRIEKW